MNAAVLIAAGGNGLLALALLAALGGIGASLAAVFGKHGSRPWGRILAWLALGSTAAAALGLLVLILGRRYDIAYVADYTSRDLAFFYRLSAFWAGQQGSLLLWLLFAAVLTVLQLRRAGDFEPYVLLLLCFVQAGLAVLLLLDSPFQVLAGVATPPADGYGLNPLLQNPWMVLHPPVLFWGYAGLAVPFAYALAGLWRRDYDGWLRPALPWALLAWFSLGLGIYLGALWSYETLGWGGYWGWDLVENSSLIPWLTATALLHGMLLQRYRQRLRRANFLLAIATFALVLWATFLTRSGVLGAFSVHSFGLSALTPWMLGLLGLVLTVGLGLFLVRVADIPVGGSGEEAPGDKGTAVGAPPSTWLSRDLTFPLTLVLLLAIAAPLWFGTLVPLVSQIGGGTPAILDAAVYPLTTGPWVAILMLVLCLCPLLGWSGTELRRVLYLLRVPAVLAFVGTVVAVVLGVRDWVGILFVLLAALAASINGMMGVRSARGGLCRLGGSIAHVGLGLLLLGIVISTMYSVEGPVLALSAGETGETLGYRLTFLGEGGEVEEHRTLWFDVERGGLRFAAAAERRYDSRGGNWIGAPVVRRSLDSDLYLAVEGYEHLPGTEIQMAEGQVVQVAGYTLTLQSLSVEDPYVVAAILVEKAGQSQVITPSYAFPENGAVGRPAYLPGGETLTVEEAFPVGSDLVVLSEGVAVPVGEYLLTMRDFYVEMPDDLAGTVRAGAIVEVSGPQGTRVVTPTQVVGPAGLVASPPVALSPGVTLTLLQMAVEERAVLLRVEGLGAPPQGGMAVLLIREAGATGRAYVRLSLKPAMNLVWGGALLLLLGTVLAAVRRWREVGGWGLEVGSWKSEIGVRSEVKR